jgi:branched-chain amino acid transport system permease protein
VMVIVGGMGNIWGVIVGASVIAWLNFAGLGKIGSLLNDLIPGEANDVDVPKYKFGIFGIMLILMMLFRPQGIIPSARRKAEFEEGEGEASLYDAAR